MAKRLPSASLPWPITVEAVFMLCDREDCRNKAYRDFPKGIWTCGWGETDNVTPTTVWTDEECDQKLLDSLKVYTEAVLAMCKVPPTDNQLGALVVCAYNIGLEAMRNSTMMRMHNAGNFAAAARAFNLWVNARDPATGKLIELPILVESRAREAALYMKPDGGHAVRAPQAVEPEPSLTASPTVLGGATATAVGAGTLVTSVKEVGDVVSDFAKDTAADLGVTPVQVLAAFLLVVGVLVLYRRFSQRNRGVA